MRYFLAASAGLLALAVCGAEPAPTDNAPLLKVVKYPELMRTVRNLQGKVVVVDFWGEF